MKTENRLLVYLKKIRRGGGGGGSCGVWGGKLPPYPPPTHTHTLDETLT